MNYKRIDESVEIIDVTTDKDDPYNDWKVRPEDKFRVEMLEAGYTDNELYTIDIDGESGIIMDYELYPHEKLKWDKTDKNIKLKMQYPPIHKFRKALRELGINYDETYWDQKVSVRKE